MRTHTKNNDWVLRIISFYKLAKAALFIATAVGLLHLLHHNVESILLRILESYHVDSENRLIKWILDSASNLTDNRLRSLSIFCFIGGILFATEGIGLYLRQRWAEYLVVIVTGSLLPLEAYEVLNGITILKVFILAGNLAILLYLIYRLRVEEVQIKE